jgi:hypothetical protein
MGGGQVVKGVLDDRRTHYNSELNKGDVKLGWVEQSNAKYSTGAEKRRGRAEQRSSKLTAKEIIVSTGKLGEVEQRYVKHTSLQYSSAVRS